jgi:predicted metal-binding protein
MSEKIEKVIPPWLDGIIMVCTKCGRKMGSEEISDKLKHDLKSLVKHGDFDKNIRVVTTSCLDICPDDRIAVAYSGHGKTKVVTVEEKIDPKELLQDLIK